MSVSAMKKLTVLAYEADADAIVRKLMRLRCVEIRQAGTGEGLMPVQSAASDAKRAESERRLAAIGRAIPHLAKYTTRRRGIGRTVHRVDTAAFVRDGRADAAWRAVEAANAISDRTEALTAERTRVLSEIEALTPWLGYDAPLDEVGSKRTSMILGSYPPKSDPVALRETLEAAGAYVEVVAHDESGLFLSLTALREDMAALERTLAAGGFLRAALPTVDCTARTAVERAEARVAQLEGEVFAAEEQLRDLSEFLDDVEILYDIEATTVNVCLQKRKLAATKNCVVLEGWIPMGTEDKVASTLSKFECACEIAEPEEGEEPPVLLKNNGWASNFEWVLGMYSYPKYGTFDPTFIMSIFYFILFGLMFADVGYGLILTLCCFGGIKLLNPKPGMRRMLAMFGLCGISCMVMGVLFGGWFGDLPTAIMSNMLGLPIDTGVGHFFGSGLWLNPIDDPMTFLIISLAVGAIHLIAGMAVNFYILCRAGRPMEAVCTILPYWVLFAGLGLFLVDGTVALYVALAGAALILCLNGYGQKSIFSRITKGLGGLYGLINYAADLLSYSRVLALGMVAGVVAKVINMITALGTKGPVGFVFMLIILILGHVLNIGINILGTFVHTARLQYIEFFGKFYEDGGEPFTPALPSEEYTEEADDQAVPNSNT